MGEIFSSLSHLLAAPAALAFGIWSIRSRRGHPLRTAAFVLFTVAAVVLLATSGVYHLMSNGTTAREVFRRLDHTAIWIMIACSFTAIHMLGFNGRWRWIPSLLVWAAALFGIVFKVLFFESFSELVWLVLYLAVGWLGLFSMVRLAIGRRWSVVKPFALGGALYTSGAVLEYFRALHLVPKIVGPHEIFHLAVIGGIAMHWRLLLRLADGLPKVALDFRSPQALS